MRKPFPTVRQAAAPRSVRRAAPHPNEGFVGQVIEDVTTGKRGGPVVPTAAARSAVRPLGHDEVQLAPDGLLGAWQRRNLTVTVPHVLDRVEAGEALGNLRRVLARAADPAGAAGVPDGGAAPFEGMVFTDSDVHKTLEAVAWASIALDPADKRLARAEALVAVLSRVQAEDGYLNSWVQGDPAATRWAHPQWGHELYTAGHLFQAAVAAERTGVLPGLLGVATRFADLLVERFGDDPDYLDGHAEVETALVELYRATGEPGYLRLAARQLEARGRHWLGEGGFGPAYFQDEVPLRAAQTATGHAVRQLYLLTGAVDVAVETHDEELLAAAVRVWEDLAATKTYVTGAHGSRHRDESIGDPYELPPDRAYAESCAAIAGFQLAWRLLLATGEARFADAMETVLYNGLAVAVSESGDRFFYSNPLHLRTGHQGEPDDAPSQRQPWFRCACCPPNLARLFASVHDYLFTRTSDGERAGERTGVQLQHPASADVQLVLAGGPVALRLRTGYPYDGGLDLELEGGGAWELAVRIPAWCEGFTAELDGQPVPAEAPDGYLRLYRDWSGPHRLSLRLAMPPRWVAAHPRADAVRGCLALARGPLLYALEQADLPDGTVLEDVLLLAGEGVRAQPQHPVVQNSVAQHSVAQQPNAPVLLTARFSTAEPVTQPYRATTGAVEPSTRPTFDSQLVPYHTWGNRSPGAMRVWLPVAHPVPEPRFREGTQ